MKKQSKFMHYVGFFKLTLSIDENGNVKWSLENIDNLSVRVLLGNGWPFDWTGIKLWLNDYNQGDHLIEIRTAFSILRQQISEPLYFVPYFVPPRLLKISGWLLFYRTRCINT